MHDQSLDRVNGRSMAALAICERKLNMASVLKSAGKHDAAGRWGSGMHRNFGARQGAYSKKS